MNVNSYIPLNNCRLLPQSTFIDDLSQDKLPEVKDDSRLSDSMQYLR